MTFKIDRRVFYAVVAVLALGGALAVGLLVGRGSGAPGSTAQVDAPADPAALPTSAVAPIDGAPTVDPAFAELPRIEIADAFQRFEQGDALFVDARASGEFTYEHIPGAVNIPYTEAEARMGELPTDKDIIVYCA